MNQDPTPEEKMSHFFQVTATDGRFYILEEEEEDPINAMSYVFGYAKNDDFHLVYLDNGRWKDQTYLRGSQIVTARPLVR